LTNTEVGGRFSIMAQSYLSAGHPFFCLAKIFMWAFSFEDYKRFVTALNRIV